MDAAQARGLVELAHVAATAADTDALLAAALPIVQSVTGAAVVRRTGGASESLAGAARSLAGGLTLALTGAAADDAVVTTSLDILDGGLARLLAGERLADLATRVDSAQQLADMGDYDWHIATDVNQWSDQLYRIYGHEPQSFNPSYERFLSFIHPDDRERITGIHQQAYASGEPYQMIERIVRPDGEVRYLSSNGQVIRDDTGTPIRMRGTCIDITDTVAAERSREHLAARFRGLVESSPDAILVVDVDGSVVQANARAARLLGGAVVGHHIGDVLAWPAPDAEQVPAIGFDGRELLLDVTTSPLSDVENEGMVAVFLHDAKPRLANEQVTATLREAEVRRRQALEINDNVVQGLTAASFSMDRGDLDATATYLERTLAAARKIMDDWLNPLDGADLKAGDLVRSVPSSLEPEPPADGAPGSAARRSGEPCRLLIADDYADMRQLMRMQLELATGYEVVGEAADGVEAVRMATDLQPHVVLLDLAMPGMDGLEALPLIRAAVDGVQVIALSGFDRVTMAEKVLAAGAARYVEKGLSMNLTSVIDEVLAGAEA